MKSFLFKPDMVRAILTGRKTQTRRLHAKPRFRVGERAYVKEPWRDGDPLPRWRSPLFMPERAARIFLELTAVRVQRLQDISETDAINEGVKQTDLYEPTELFAFLWDSINGPPNDWNSNPAVVAYTFKVVTDGTD